ncbi:MAG: hypothetical protein MJZ03_01030 [archaeon]|nr:hypothetical protein [archaeon]
MFFPPFEYGIISTDLDIKLAKNNPIYALGWLDNIRKNHLRFYYATDETKINNSMAY